MGNKFDFLKGTNFYVALLMAIFGGLIGTSEEQINQLVGSGFIITGFIFAAREKIKANGVSWLAWIKNPNTLNYLLLAASYALPKLPSEFFEQVNSLIAAIVGRNWSGMISALFSIGTIIFFLIYPKSTPAKA